MQDLGNAFNLTRLWYDFADAKHKNAYFSILDTIKDCSNVQDKLDYCCLATRIIRSRGSPYFALCRCSFSPWSENSFRFDINLPTKNFNLFDLIRWHTWDNFALPHGWTNQSYHEHEHFRITCFFIPKHRRYLSCFQSNWKLDVVRSSVIFAYLVKCRNMKESTNMVIIFCNSFSSLFLLESSAIPWSAWCIILPWQNNMIIFRVVQIHDQDYQMVGSVDMCNSYLHRSENLHFMLIDDENGSQKRFIHHLLTHAVRVYLNFLSVSGTFK